ncbi:Pumilio-like protein [Quillaja saponaria]|uniref:Pumilio-like protein n=1 Tax=Quillaja saponaria TaxID=32244 RepID=A0AAD7KUR2_QUISA|nr:Pumilio-like protein [Quillaja saponaria]
MNQKSSRSMESRQFNPYTERFSLEYTEASHRSTHNLSIPHRPPPLPLPLPPLPPLPLPQSQSQFLASSSNHGGFVDHPYIGFSSLQPPYGQSLQRKQLQDLQSMRNESAVRGQTGFYGRPEVPFFVNQGLHDGIAYSNSYAFPNNGQSGNLYNGNQTLTATRNHDRGGSNKGLRMENSSISFQSSLNSNNNQRNHSSLEDFRRQVVPMAKDQFQCRFLHAKLDNWNLGEVAVILSEVKDHVHELIVNFPANSLVLKIFEESNDVQKTELLTLLFQNELKLKDVCVNKQGALAIQKLLEHLQTPQQIDIVVSALKRITVTLSKNCFGRMVIQESLKRFSREFKKILLNEIANNCLQIATDYWGLTTIKCCLEVADREALNLLGTQIVANALTLANYRCGNYVIQFAIRMMQYPLTEYIVRRFKGNYVQLSMHKYGRQMVEFLLKYANERDALTITEEIIEKNSFVDVATDQCGNYVIQTALQEKSSGSMASRHNPYAESYNRESTEASRSSSHNLSTPPHSPQSQFQVVSAPNHGVFVAYPYIDTRYHQLPYQQSLQWPQLPYQQSFQWPQLPYQQSLQWPQLQNLQSMRIGGCGFDAMPNGVPFLVNGGLQNRIPTPPYSNFNDLPNNGQLGNLYNVAPTLMETKNHTVPSFSSNRMESRRSFQSALNNINNQRNYSSIEEVRGHVISVAKDAFGCRFLHEKLDEGKSDEVEMILSEVKGHLHELMLNRVSHSLVKRIFRESNNEQRKEFLELLVEDEQKLKDFCVDSRGSGIMRTLLDYYQTREQLSVLSALKNIIVTLSTNWNGHFIIRKCLKLFSGKHQKVLLDGIAENCAKIALDSRGCMVIKSCLHQADRGALEHLEAKIVANAFYIAKDRHGNYFIQYAIMFLQYPFTANIVRQFIGSYVQLSMHKYGCHVVQFLLTFTKEVDASTIIQDIIKTNSFVDVATDPYGNYVVQRALQVSKFQFLDSASNHGVLEANPYIDTRHHQLPYHQSFQRPQLEYLQSMRIRGSGFGERPNEVPFLVNRGFQNRVATPPYSNIHDFSNNGAPTLMETRNHMVRFSSSNRMESPRSFQSALNNNNNQRNYSSIEEVRGQVISVAQDAFGSRFLQKKLDEGKPDEFELIFSEVKGQLHELMLNRVLLDGIAENCVEIALDSKGCMVIKYCLRQADRGALEHLEAKIVANAFYIAKDRHGNYIIQYAIRFLQYSFTANIVRQLIGSYVQLSMHKYGYHVVQSLLTHAKEVDASTIIQDIIETNSFVDVATDPYGNHIVLIAMQVSKRMATAEAQTIHNDLSTLIENNYAKLLDNSYGRRVIVISKSLN